MDEENVGSWASRNQYLGVSFKGFLQLMARQAMSDKAQSNLYDARRVFDKPERDMFPRRDSACDDAARREAKLGSWTTFCFSERNRGVFNYEQFVRRFKLKPLFYFCSNLRPKPESQTMRRKQDCGGPRRSNLKIR